MSTEIDARIWFEEGKESDALKWFLALVNAADSSESISGKWQQFAVIDALTNEKLVRLDQDVQPAGLEELAAAHAAGDVAFRIYVPMRCWRFSGMKAEDAFVMLGLTVWSPGFLRARKLDPASHGHAQLSVLDAGPFFELIDEASLQHPHAAQLNEQIAVNTQSFTHLMLGICAALPVSRMYTFTDLGDYLLHNAHAAFFASTEVLCEAAGHYLQTLRQGGKAGKSLAAATEAGDQWYFHELRSEQQRQSLRNALQQLVVSGNAPDQSRVSQVLDSGEFDFFDEGGSLMLLDFPYLFNAFLDRFFIRLTEA